MNSRTKILICVGGLFLQTLSAQKTVVEASIDSAAILIGEQTKIHLSVTTPQNASVQLPLIADTIVGGIEVLDISKPDTIMSKDGLMTIKQDYLVTSFDSALYLIPPFKVVENADTLLSKALALKVSTLPVEEGSEDFFDIKGVETPPFVLSDYYPIIGSILGLLALAALAYYVYKRLKDKKSLMPFKKSEPQLPPHERAISALNEIKSHKLWQQGLNKEYYTQITDVLRQYIEERYNIQAMEMTSNEILDLLSDKLKTDPSLGLIEQILKLSDLVKFAKFSPLPDENEISIRNAYTFVESTKEIVAVDEAIPSQENVVSTSTEIKK